MYGLKHTLILRRNCDDDAIIRIDNEENDKYKVTDGKVAVLKLL